MASQKTKEEMNYENCGLCYSDSDYEDENPEPTWNLRNWKGNIDPPTVCGGCITRTTCMGDTRGCIECDDCWDMPDLVVPLSMAEDQEEDQDEDEELFGDYNGPVEISANYCEGCELLKAGTGGENQMAHACMGY